MGERFRGILVTKSDDSQKVEITEIDSDDLPEGDVTVAVEYSTVNYKDGLAITGRSPIIRRFPMVPGIDLAGMVERGGGALLYIAHRPSVAPFHKRRWQPMARKMPGADAPATPLPQSTTSFIGRARRMSPTMRSR